MEFDRTKIKTIATCEDVKVGDKGWFSDDIHHLLAKVALGDDIDTIEKVNIEPVNGPFQPIHGEFSCRYFYPYEPPKKQYRKFANAEEFAPFRDRWARYINPPASVGIEIFRAGWYTNDRVMFLGIGPAFSFEEAYDTLLFEDGTPFGVEV